VGVRLRSDGAFFFRFIVSLYSRKLRRPTIQSTNMSRPYPRHIHFESVPNFRDLGGYRTHDGRTVAWRRLFRSAALHKMNDPEMARLKQEIGPRTVIDLRSPKDPERNSAVVLFEEIGARYHPIPFSTWPWPGPSKRPDSSCYVKDEAQAHPNATNMGEIYLNRITRSHSARGLSTLSKSSLNEIITRWYSIAAQARIGPGSWPPWSWPRWASSMKMLAKTTLFQPHS
jgi:Tyrosine phosphatase family